LLWSDLFYDYLLAHRGDLHSLLDAFKSGVPVDIRDKFYQTPLMIAAANGDLETTKFLLQCGY
jgi:ankyrin repeat protein